MNEKEAYALHSQIETKADMVELGQSLKNLSNGYGIGKCFSCSHSWVMRTRRQNEPIVRCNEVYNQPLIVPHDIEECSRYDKKGELDIMTLIKMHNPVDVSKPDKVAGFSKEQSESTEANKL